MSDSERGKPAGFDRRSGEVHGSGADAGGGGQGREDYDQDPMAGSRSAPLARFDQHFLRNSLSWRPGEPRYP